MFEVIGSLEQRYVPKFQSMFHSVVHLVLVLV